MTQPPTPDPLDDALGTYPLAPAPRDLARRVQTAIARYPRFVRPPFRLGWIDLALSGFGTLMALLALLLWRWLLTPTGGWAVTTQLVIGLQVARFPQWAGLILLALAAALGALAFAAALFTQPARR